MFLELCEQVNLEKRIVGRLTEEETLLWFGQLVDGMSYMNSQSTHRISQRCSTVTSSQPIS
jgi:hypothetical protein